MNLRHHILDALSARVRRGIDNQTGYEVWSDICPNVCQRLDGIQLIDERAETWLGTQIYAEL